MLMITEETLKELKEKVLLGKVKTISDIKDICGFSKVQWSFTWDLFTESNRSVENFNSTNFYINLGVADYQLKYTDKDIKVYINVLDENMNKEVEEWEVNSIKILE